MTKSFKKLYSNKNDYIAYKEQIYHKNKKSIIWFGGLNSDMEGTKAKYLSNFSRRNKINFCRFDYFGHGRSSKKFQVCTISDWLDNGIKVIDNITEGSPTGNIRGVKGATGFIKPNEWEAKDYAHRNNMGSQRVKKIKENIWSKFITELLAL